MTGQLPPYEWPKDEDPDGWDTRRKALEEAKKRETKDKR